MSVLRSQLGRGPAIVTRNGATFFTRDDLVARHNPVWNPEKTSMFGVVDKSRRDVVIKIPLVLWGAWENVTELFPAAVLNPTVGASLLDPATDVPLVIQARNGDRITYTNTALTKLVDLYLGVDSELFAAAVEYTAILGNGKNPEDDFAYYKTDTGAYADGAFSKANFKKVRFTGAWGAKTGFTTVVPKEGFRVAWNLDVKEDKADGLGTVDLLIGEGGMQGATKCIPIGPSITQIETALQLGAVTGSGKALGTLLSSGAADLTMTGSGISVVTKNASLVESGYVFGIEKLRNGEMAWETTRGFTAGVPQAVGTVS